MDCVEIYILCENRTQSLALKFLNSFASNRKKLAEDYPFPMYTDEPNTVYTDDDEIITTLEKQPEEPYSLYWSVDEESVVKHIMLFYTEDEGLIAGIAVEDTDYEKWLNRIAKEVNGDYGCVNFNCPPPDKKSEFIELCINSDQVKILQGKIVN